MRNLTEKLIHAWGEGAIPGTRITEDTQYADFGIFGGGVQLSRIEEMCDEDTELLTGFATTGSLGEKNLLDKQAIKEDRVMYIFEPCTIICNAAGDVLLIIFVYETHFGSYEAETGDITLVGHGTIHQMNEADFNSARMIRTR